MKHLALSVLVLFCAAAPAAAERALLNEYYNVAVRKRLPVVIDLPEDADRAKAAAYVKGIHDEFFKDSELLDASRLGPEELKARLGGGFVLYTVLGRSKVLPAVRKPEFKFSGGRLTVAGETYSGGLRYITLAADPYREGAWCEIYAASSNALVDGINSVMHGPASYHVYRGSRQAGEGYFDEDFAYAPRGLSLAQAAEDIADFFARCEHVHPDLLASLTAEKYLALKERTYDAALARARKGRVAVRDLAYELYYAAAAFRDGHTSLYYKELPLKELDEAGYPPFLFEYRNGRFFAARAADKGLEGAELLGVDGRPFAEFAAPVLERCSGEILPFRAQRFAGSQQFWWAISGLLTGRRSVELKYRAAGGAEVSRRFSVLDGPAFERLGAGEKKKEESTRLDYLAGGGVAYFRYPAFNYSEKEKAAVDGIFADLKKKGARQLIIDIRGNGGGNSSMGDHIMSYLTDRPVRSFSRVQEKISDEVLADRRYREMLGPAAALRGLVVTTREEELKRPKPENFYDGRAYLLVDNGTFSSATDFASMFRDYERGVILGYETGGLPTCFGDVFSLTLPNSGIKFGVSYKRFYAPRPKPGDDEHGLLPDVPFTDEKLAPYGGEDPGLSFTLDYLQKGG